MPDGINSQGPNRHLGLGYVGMKVSLSNVENKESFIVAKNEEISVCPDPSFTPSSLPVLVPILDLPQSQSVASSKAKLPANTTS